MEKLSNSSHFLDLGGLDSLRSQAQKDEKGALKEVAKQFEGIFIQMLMKSMRDANAAFKSDSPMNSQTTEFFENMRDQQMSVDLSDKGMLGIADLMVQQLSPQDTPFKPASVLRGDIDAKISHSLFDGTFNKGLAQEASVNQASTMNASSLCAIGSGKPAVNINQLSSSHNVIDEQTLEKILAGNITSSVASSGNQLPQTIHQAPTEFENPQHFVSVLYPHAEKAAKTLGTTPEVLLAQSALETGWGQKMIRRQDGSASNNLFNIKADSRWQGDKTSVNTLEYEQGIAVKQKADFRMYESVEHSFNDFVSFISNGERYQDARKVAAEPAKFINALQKAGYATDPQYAQKVLKVMESVTNGLKSVLPGETN
ncbi:flagellar assembly peptidoglycan hydrolase FlgJ [Shewanella olleyana]|uniref:flagellar assembly peptidoglycan hydrolase FlgJ n=1 Tax=Shewanella olleyana TaxID=135626 RepID=UPI00200DE8CF|nr:flagellar assembly peptidoglycan hydrolase FlgJ [Shewanella olleyana]MCL1066562.1 flagellar assembly peptidoglycan hydrolase FlgJ [Shewanella olleyana]